MKTIALKILAMIMVVTLSVGVLSVGQKAEAKESKDYTIKVNLGTNCTTIYKNGKAIKAMICSPSSETPVGTFYIPVKYRWHEMIGNCYAQYCSRITTGVLFHSVWYYRLGDKSSMSVGAYNVMGQKASHGCVRLLCKDAKWIYDHCAVGTKINIFWGSTKDDPLKRPSFTRISNGKFTDWDPTDPDPKNPYNKAKPTITATETKIEYGKKIKDLTSLVTIKDSAGNVLTKSNAKITVKGKINTKKLGKYKLIYTVKDSLGNARTKTIKFTVVDTKKPILKGVKSKNNVALDNTLNLKQGITAKAVSGKNLTSKVQVTVKKNGKKVRVQKGAVTFSKTGTYKITYKVKGPNKKVATKTVRYKVTNQKVKLNLSAKTVTIMQGTDFDPNAYVESLTTYTGKTISKKNITVTGSVDTNIPGTYTITYNAQHGDKTYTSVVKTLVVTVEALPEQTEGESL